MTEQADGAGPDEIALADAIPVAGFRTTLFWPLTLDLPPVTNTAFWNHPSRDSRDTDIAHFFDEQVALIDRKKVWTRVDDPLDHLGEGKSSQDQTEDQRAKRENARADALAEFAYFHDFVQHFLFARQKGGDGPPDSEPFHLYRRDDIARVSVTLAPLYRAETPARCFDLTVDRLRLYVFRIGVAVLVAEVSASGSDAVAMGEGARRGLHLADVQDFNDRFRRVYAPYLPTEEGSVERIDPPLVPVSVVWRDRDGADAPMKRGAPEPSRRIADLWDPTRPERFLVPFAHWYGLLPDAWTVGATGGDGLSWRQVFDERMPLLSWVSVSAAKGQSPETHYNRIRKGDWMRLCFVDEAGRAPYPYDPNFLEPFGRENVYDRFHDVPPEPEQQREGRARFLISSYALVSVGCGGFYDDLVSMHMRRHYFQMALLLHFELAALLSISGRISRAMADYEDEAFAPKTRTDAEPNLARRLQTIERDFLQFVHRFRFTGVSNQLQPSEMFEQMRARMRLPAIYADIKDEITTATGFLATRASERQAEAAGRLSVVATLGLVLGLPMTFLGMNVLTSSDFLKDGLTIGSAAGAWPKHALAFVAVTLFAFVGASVLVHLPNGVSRHRDPAADALRATLKWGVVIFGVATVFACAALLTAVR